MHVHSQGNQNLIPFDLEIEATARKQSGETRKKKAEITMAGRDLRVSWDYILPQAYGVTSSIISLTIKANNFKLCPALATFMEGDQFGGHPPENYIFIFTISLQSMIPENSTGFLLTQFS